jgi:protein-disulfide isomerase
MNLSRKDLWWLAAAVALAVLFSLFIRSQRSLGEDIGANPLALAVHNDRTSPVEGDSAADLTLILFVDYRCPGCRTAHSAMKRAVASDGKVRIVYKDWPVFGATSERAAQIAIASDYQKLYPQVHDRLMTGPVDGEDALRAAVEQSGGSWQRVQSDLATHRTEIEAQIARNKMQAFQLGMGGTPAYLIGPIRVRGALTEREFRRVFAQARAAN